MKIEPVDVTVRVNIEPAPSPSEQQEVPIDYLGDVLANAAANAIANLPSDSPLNPWTVARVAMMPILRRHLAAQPKAPSQGERPDIMVHHTPGSDEWRLEAEEYKTGLAAFKAFEPPLDRGIGHWDYFLAGWKARRRHDDEQIARHL